MGGDDPGCAYSKHPLSGLEGGFVDHELIGRWHRLAWTEDDFFTVEEVIYDVSPDISGEFLLIKHLEPDEEGTHPIDLYAGHSTRIGDATYLNRRFLDCMSCTSEESVEARKASSCPFEISKYQVNLSLQDLLDLLPKVEDAEDDEEAAEDAKLLEDVREAWSDLRGYTLQVWFPMDPDFIKEAIEAEVISGSVGDHVCMTAEPQLLRDFIAIHDGEIFAGGGYFELLAKEKVGVLNP
jgi:hypothetical protein